MSKPVVAIVGRPNVGKSTLFNTLAGERISIVKDTPGVTRDRIYADVSWLDKEFTMIDTGGIEPDSSDIILSQMREQAQIAIDTADVIVFITDVRQGLVGCGFQSGRYAAAVLENRLCLLSTRWIILINLCRMCMSFIIWESEIRFRSLRRPGWDSVICWMKWLRIFRKDAGETEEDERPKIAIVGKPNVGKSSIINKLLGENRVIVSDIAGTTRDAIDTAIKHDGQRIYFYRYRRTAKKK